MPGAKRLACAFQHHNPDRPINRQPGDFGRERGQHRIGVLIDGHADRVDVRGSCVVAGVFFEDRRALLLEGLDVEGAATDLRAVRHRIPLLETLAVSANHRLNHVLRQDEELLQLWQDVCDGLVVGDHERRRVGRLEVGRMRDERRHHCGRSLAVLDHEVASKGSVGSRDRLTVGPRAVGLDLEGPDLAVARGGPRVGPVARDLVVGVVLDKRRVGLGPEDVRERGEADERVDRVGIRGRANTKDAAFLDGCSLCATRCCTVSTTTRCGRFAAATGREQCDSDQQDDAYE